MKLFTTIDEFRKYAGVSVSLSMETLEPNELSAINYYLIPAIGEMYQALQEAYDSPPVAGKMKELLDLVQPALAKFTVLLWSPEGALHINDSGIMVQKSENFAPASDAKIDKLDKKYLQEGYADLERLLAYLEKNKDEAEFQPWKDSSAFTLFNQFFLSSAVQFKEYVPISGRHTFLQMKGFIRDSQVFDIKPVLQKALFDEILSKVKQGAALAPEEKELMELVQPALAHLSFARALATLTVVQDERGISLYNTNNTQTTNAWKNADKELIATLRDYHKGSGEQYLAALQELLENGSYTGYTKAANGLAPYENRPDSPNFYML